MTFSKSASLTGRVKVVLSIILFTAIVFYGCGGDDDLTLLPKITGNDKITDAASNEPVFASQEEEDKYFADLEARLNEKLAGPSAAPSKCATTGLLSVTLNQTTDEIKTTETYDLASKIVVTANVAGQQPKVITPVWTKYSGSGTLNGTVYTSIAKCETAVFTATYTEEGVSKLALFRLKVNGLTALALSKTTAEIQLPATFDLRTELAVTAKYYNGTTKEIDTTSGLVWTTNGSGTLNGTVYTPAKVESPTFTATYVDSGITKTAAFRLTVTGLSSLTLSKVTDEIQLPEIYDLASKITVTSKLSNGQTSVVSPVWSLYSGKGTLTGSVYTPGAFYETAVFIASYAEPNTTLTKTAQFRLTVTGLYSISLSQVTDEIQLPATYDLASELVVKALYSDKSTQEITTAPNLTWTLTSGAGILAGSLYTPAAKVETAVFTANYADAGITKTARFSLKVIGLSSLTLNKTTDEVQSCATYNLAEKLVLTDKLSNGTIRTITTDPNTIWSLTSGRGTLAGMVYTAPALAETAVITAKYTEAGITKSINFRLRVNALTAVTLNKITDEALISTPYDLASKLVVFAKFSNGQTVEVTTNPNLKWTISYGSGALNGAVYTTPERIETTVLVATYTVNGVAQSARFSLKVTAAAPGTRVQLVSVSINKSTDSVQVNGTYDLATLVPIAKYSDKTTREVTLSWIVTSGGGSVAGNIYTAAANIGTVRLMGSCTAEDGSVKSVSFILTIFSDHIYGYSGMVSPNGIIFYLPDSIEVEIPANAVNNVGTFNISKPVDACFNINGQGIMQFTSTINIQNIIIRMPTQPSTTIDDVNAIFVIQSQGVMVPAIKRIFNGYCEFTIGGSNNTYSGISKMIGFNEPIPGLPIIGLGPTKFIYSKFSLTKPKDGSQSSDDVFYDRIKANNSVEYIKWPRYMQFDNTCWATSLLMFMRGYNKNISSEFDAIYKIVKKFSSYVDQNGYGNYLCRDSDPPLMQLMSFVLVKSSMNIPEKILNYASINVIPYYCVDKYSLLNLLVWNLSRNSPVMVSSRSHCIVFLGYSYDPPKDAPAILPTDNNKISSIIPNIYFYINDPDSLSVYNRLSFQNIIDETLKHRNDGFNDYIAFTSNPMPNGSSNLVTMHLTESKIININNPGHYISSTIIATTSDDGIAWSNTAAISKGTNIVFGTRILNSSHESYNVAIRCKAISPPREYGTCKLVN